MCSRCSCLTLRRQCKTEEELVAALQEAEDHPDSCAPANMSPCHHHACLLTTLGTAQAQTCRSHHMSPGPAHSSLLTDN